MRFGRRDELCGGRPLAGPGLRKRANADEKIEINNGAADLGRRENDDNQRAGAFGLPDEISHLAH